MKSLIILVTILSSYLAVVDLIPTEKIQSKQNENIANTKLKSLSSLTGELDIEKEWKKEKRKLDQQIAERNKPKKPKAKPKKEKGPSVPELTIAGVKFKLLAVSISTQEPDICLKPNNKPAPKGRSLLNEFLYPFNPKPSFLRIPHPRKRDTTHPTVVINPMIENTNIIERTITEATHQKRSPILCSLTTLFSFQ